MFGKSYRLLAASFTSKGSREINEDAIGSVEKDKSICMALCDGLGGHGMGDRASSLAVQTMLDTFQEDMKITDFIQEAFSRAQARLLQEQEIMRARSKMKTTACLLASDGKKAHIAHVGDSRVYTFMKDGSFTRTLDHSVPQMLALSGEIQESEIRHHPDRNIVMRVLGVEWEKTMYEIEKAIPLKNCRAFLMCTDGFWEWIDEENMMRTLQEASDPGDWIRRMVQIVERSGQGSNMDNFSAIAAWVL